MTSTPVPDDATRVGAGASSGALAEAVGAAQEALRAAGEAARHLGGLSAAGHLAALEELAVVQRLADAVGFAVVDSLAGRGRGDLHALGATSVTDAVARAGGTSHALARRRVTTASSVRPDRGAGDLGDHGAPALPVLGTVHAEGRLSTEVLEMALRTVAALPARLRRRHQVQVDALLADNLPGLGHGDARALCEHLLDRIDPDRADRGFDPDDAEKRRVTVTKHADGWVGVHGLLDPVNGAQLVAGLDHFSRPAPPVAAAVAPVDADGAPLPVTAAGGLCESGDVHVEPGTTRADAAASVAVRDTRTARQRRADALGLIARQGVAHSGTRGGEPPRVVVTATLDQVAGARGAGRAVCDQTGPLPTAALRALTSRAVLQAVVLSASTGDASVLALGRAVRCFTPAQRRAMYARDGGCVHGCDAPFAWLEAHHVVDWAAGGATDVDNGVLACPHHHLGTTLGHWEARMIGGAPQIRPPRAVDPLRRWLWAPRRAVTERAAALVERLLCGADPPWAA